MDDLFVHVDQEGETASYPVVLLLADGHVDQLLPGDPTRNWLVLLEGEELEHQRDALTRLQEEGAVLAHHIEALGFGVVAAWEREYCLLVR